MKIESPLHAEHQLDQLAGQFEHWRQTRTHPSERFPQALWDQAVALAATLPPTRVAKQLRLRLIDLKKQMATAHAAPPAVPAAEAAAGPQHSRGPGVCPPPNTDTAADPAGRDLDRLGRCGPPPGPAPAGPGAWLAARG